MDFYPRFIYYGGNQCAKRFLILPYFAWCSHLSHHTDVYEVGLMQEFLYSCKLLSCMLKLQCKVKKVLLWYFRLCNYALIHKHIDIKSDSLIKRLQLNSSSSFSSIFNPTPISLFQNNDCYSFKISPAFKHEQVENGIIVRVLRHIV